jgi:hypothetical protein
MSEMGPDADLRGRTALIGYPELVVQLGVTIHLNVRNHLQEIQ